MCRYRTMSIYGDIKGLQKEAISFTRTKDSWKKTHTGSSSGLKWIRNFAILTRVGKLLPANHLFVEKRSFRADNALCQI